MSLRNSLRKRSELRPNPIGRLIGKSLCTFGLRDRPELCWLFPFTRVFASAHSLRHTLHTKSGSDPEPTSQKRRSARMASAAIVLPHPRSPGSHGPSPVKSDTPSVRPPSPSAPPSMFAPHNSAVPAYERRDSAESENDETGRSQSTPMTRPISPIPKRTNSTGNLPSFLDSAGAVLSPPSFHATNHRNSSPESRRTRSSENLPTLGSSPDSSPQPQHSSLGGTPYHNGQGMSMRHPDHHLYSNQDYDSLMRPKKRHKTSRACDECRRKKVCPYRFARLMPDPL